MDSPLIIRFSSTAASPALSVTILGETADDSLKESCRYEYELEMPGYSLREVPGVLAHSRIKHDRERGLIEPGNFVGLLKLELMGMDGGHTLAEAHVQVRSTKLRYEDEYRAMLEDIAEKCADFLMQLDSPVEGGFLPDGEIDEPTLAQRLYFLKSLLGSEGFEQALQRIVTMPNTRWREDLRSMDVRKSRRLGCHEVRQFATTSRRRPVPAGHPFSMASMPERIEVRDKRDTVDTPENRFVKYVLSVFLDTLEMFASRLPVNGSQYPGLRAEVAALSLQLEETLAHDVFKQVAPPDMMPLSSPVLQRREGYRQVLRAWLLYSLAARLCWTGGDDVYAAGRRDAAALYEYWVFFRLLDLVADLFTLDNPPVADLIDCAGLVLKLKAGKHLPIRGVYAGLGRRLCVQFSYNRTFGGEKAYPDSGSWSRQMRPDYTLSLWPTEFSAEEAERQELITHVHFDAKYKVDGLIELFGRVAEEDGEQSEQILAEEKEQQRSGTYKRGDLLKMHAYRDAIRRSAGAYVIYPGADEKGFRGFHELLPGLGAFPLRPGCSDDGSAALKTFLGKVTEHVCNRATQHEQQTYHTYRIHRNEPPEALRESLPESVDATRAPSPVEQYVLVGTCQSEAIMQWALQTGLYNFRADDRPGSLRLGPEAAGASLLLLRQHGSMQADTILRIAKEGPRVFTRETLERRGYPEQGDSEANYLVFSVKRLEPDNVLNGYTWNLSELPSFKIGHQAGWPQVFRLADLMKAAHPVNTA